MKLKRLIGSCLAMAVFAWGPVAQADDAQLMTLIQGLQKQMSQMQNTIERQESTINQQNDKIAQLAKSGGSISVAPPAHESKGHKLDEKEVFAKNLKDKIGDADKWLKGLETKGDLRLRYEAFQQTSGALTETDDRNRFRYRLRYEIAKKLGDQVKVGFGLASGEAPTASGTSAGSAAVQSDPTSTNTTFDNNFNFKSIYINKAYAAYSPNFLKDKGPLKKGTITGGKFSNPFEKGSSDIIWDRDVTPEGVAEQFEFEFLPNSDSAKFGAFATAGQFVLDEDSSAANSAGDAELYAFQLGITPAITIDGIEKPIKLLSALSYYSYHNYAKNSNFTIGGVSLARGNSNVSGSATDLDVADFEVFEFYNEVTFDAFGTPISPFVDWATNLKSAVGDGTGSGAIGTNEQNAWAFGLKVGNAKKKGEWELGWAYKYIGANAVPGFNDSDFGSSGHSGKRGNVFKAGYALTDNISLNAAAIFATNLNHGTSTIIDEQQRRFQFDLSWKF